MLPDPQPIWPEPRQSVRRPHQLRRDPRPCGASACIEADPASAASTAWVSAGRARSASVCAHQTTASDAPSAGSPAGSASSPMPSDQAAGGRAGTASAGGARSAADHRALHAALRLGRGAGQGDGEGHDGPGEDALHEIHPRVRARSAEQRSARSRRSVSISAPLGITAHQSAARSGPAPASARPRVGNW